MTLAYGVMTALLIRERTGIAQEVDASLYNSVVWALTSDIAGTLVTGKDRQATARKDRGTPLMNAYRTSGRKVAVFDDGTARCLLAEVLPGIGTRRTRSTTKIHMA